jgi:hypothetical protein
MAANGVNLDALIPREDFAAESGAARGTPTGTISIAQLADDSFLVQSLRKPDFQRETTNWTPQKIVDLISAFLDGDLIPAIILWRSGQYVFVIDGAHRVSAILAWLYDDYGDKARSRAFFENQVPEEQTKLADQTRRLVDKEIGTYASYRDAMKTMAYAEGRMKERLGGLAANSFIAQWVPAVDAEGAEKSFFKINQSPTPVDPIEKRILKARRTATAIATRAINHGGVGHKYWGDFDMAVQREIEKVGAEIYGALYLPPMGGMPIKTSDVPVGGRGYNSLPFVFDFVNLVNGVGAKEELAKDQTGELTLDYMRAVLKRVQRITTTEPGSLGLHPLVYFYTRGGAFQPVAFLAMSQVVKRLVDRNQLDRFTDVRRSFENFVMKHKEAFTLVVKRQGAGHRSRPAIEDFLGLILDGLWADKSGEEIIETMTKDSRFSFFATPTPIRGDGAGDREFSTGVKSATFVAELAQSGVRCAICGGLLHRNSIHTDHVVRRADGGGAHTGNAQLTHPYCNSGYKEGRASRGAASEAQPA